ncbi:f-box domain-containing protein [Caerostris extrusa]|uniref:F-box domain-containing protein n=1 Tax=Caerostris extrusa TaxID=172846 RepID=A0AAV4PLG8_CAEEX|nr:f-box domain-containing protein [Caerostris extrusa]
MVFMEEGTSEENARNWFLEILRIYSKQSINTKLECHFSNNETWRRVDSPKFRFLVNMIRLAYSRDKDDHPAVLYEQWLYDIGVYKRLESSIDFTVPNLKFTESMVHQLSALGQASERDLQRRKQPYKDPKYYIRRIASSRDSWMSDLFPENPCGSVCPLLMSPFLEATNHETSGLQGLAMCFSVVFERRLQNYYRTSFVSLQRIWEIVKVFTTVFLSEMLNLLPLFEGSHDLKFIVITAVG